MAANLTSSVADRTTDLPRHVEVFCATHDAPEPEYNAAGYQRDGRTLTALRNIALMHHLERVAKRFNEASVPLMVLKGAALNLVLELPADERPMCDIDVLVRPEDLDRAHALLEELRCLRSPSQFREDFFPRFYYEVQYTAGSIHPLTIDLHVRPFRMLRLSRFIPDEAFWTRARTVQLGTATVLVPADEEMLLHLCGHSAIHGNNSARWLQDIKLWCDVRGGNIDWGDFLRRAKTWRLTAAVRSAFDAASRRCGSVCPEPVRRQLARRRCSWKDRLALWHAPHDLEHPFCSVLTNLFTTPGWRFRLAYLRAVLVPDREYMEDWCLRHRCRGGSAAWLLRCFWPILGRLPRFRRRLSKLEVRESRIHGHGVFATRDIEPDEIIARYRGRATTRKSAYVTYHTDSNGRIALHEITGRLRYLNHSCRPNAKLSQFRAIALRPIRNGQEITIDYGEDACNCRRENRAEAVPTDDPRRTLAA